MPPALLISSIANSSASTTVVSLIAMVPLREWSNPTLMVSPEAAAPGDPSGAGDPEVPVSAGGSVPPQALSRILAPRVAPL